MSVCGPGGSAAKRKSPARSEAAEKDVPSTKMSAPARGGFDVWTADLKTRIAGARAPGGSGLNLVCGPIPTPTCAHLGGLPASAGPLLHYQLRGICGGLEGP